MRNNYMKKAFTLIELLTVVVIIGLIAAAAMVTLKDTAEVKALQYTKKVMGAMKNGIAEKEEGRVFTGFLNDFGTMPPNAHFLLNIENNRTNFINQTPLGKYRIVDLFDNNSSDFNISMPFLDTDNGSGVDFNDSSLNGISREDFKVDAMYIGYHGGYIGEGLDGDENRSIKDGWSKVIRFTPDLNASEDNSNSFLTITSAGSDGRFSDAGASFIKDEFNEFDNTDSIKEFYAEDYNKTFDRTGFLPRDIAINIDANIARARVLIYSPMLYYADGSRDETCTENNTTHANCTGGASGKYIPYIPHVVGAIAPTTTYDGAHDANVSWHVGVIKYDFDINATDGNVSINNQHYADINLSTSIFFKSVDINGSSITKFGNSPQDIQNPFYITAGEKEVVILLRNSDDDGWDFNATCSKIFMPGEHVKITYTAGERQCK